MEHLRTHTEGGDTSEHTQKIRRRHFRTHTEGETLQNTHRRYGETKAQNHIAATPSSPSHSPKVLINDVKTAKRL
jgi:hypothetical protein